MSGKKDNFILYLESYLNSHGGGIRRFFYINYNDIRRSYYTNHDNIRRRFLANHYCALKRLSMIIAITIIIC